MRTLTFDLETTTKKSYKRVANPFDPNNYIVAIGWKYDDNKAQYKYYDSYHKEPVLPSLKDVDILVGFNTKFDLLYVWNEPELQAFLKRGGKIYCGQYMEYLLEGMDREAHMVSMNKIADKYGGGLKIDAVKEMWEAGIDTPDIPKDLLIDYLVGDGKDIVGDIDNTYRIYKGQLERVKSMHPNFYIMFEHRMDGLLATTEMEYNGMHVDVNIGEDIRTSVANRLNEIDKELEQYIPKDLPFEFNWGSGQHKSAIIFGGTIKYQKWEQHKDEEGNLLYAQKTVKYPLVNGEPVESCSFEEQDKYKGGKNKGLGKFKNVKVDDLDKPKGAQKDFFYTFEGYTKPEEKWATKTVDSKGKPFYTTDKDTIKILGNRDIPFLKLLSERAKLSKDLGTYYYEIDSKGNKKGMLTLVDNGIIHHKLNHVNTVTSRMSSSDPNLQNLPRNGTSEVKKMFTTRYDNGLLGEIDYSQLEVVIQGVLSEDPQLTEDLNNKVDFHCKRLAKKLGEDYEHVYNMCHTVEDAVYKALRTDAKSFSFQRAYGAGAATIAEATGMSIEEVNELIAVEEELYPNLVRFDKNLEDIININRVPTSRKLMINGRPYTQGKSHWDSPTGTRYTWREHETPEFMHKHGKVLGFSPTERKNYGVQGFGGEIMQTMLGKVFRYLIENDRPVILVNTVHDCLLIDGEDEVVRREAKIIQGIMETVPEVLEEAFGMEIRVPFPCETEVGKDLYKMEVI